MDPGGAQRPGRGAAPLPRGAPRGAREARQYGALRARATRQKDQSFMDGAEVTPCRIKTGERVWTPPKFCIRCIIHCTCSPKRILLLFDESVPTLCFFLPSTVVPRQSYRFHHPDTEPLASGSVGVQSGEQSRGIGEANGERGAFVEALANQMLEACGADFIMPETLGSKCLAGPS